MTDKTAPRLSEAYLLTMEVAAARAPSIPLPPGLTQVETADWRITVNNGSAEIGGIPGFNLCAEHKTYFVIALLGPAEGCIGGMTEDEFIDRMRAFGAEGETHHA